jgi:hypothetical protein
VIVVVAVLALATIPSGIGPSVGGPATASPTGSSPAASGQGPSQPSPTLASSSPLPIAGGLSVHVPAGWHVVDLAAAGGGGAPLVALADFDLEARCGAGASAGACIASLRLVAGEIVVTIANDDTATAIAQVASPSGFDATIDGMPAVLQVVEVPPGTQVRGVPAQPGCDAHRAWWIGRPSSPTGWLDVEACSASVDRVAFRAVVDGIARSVVFGA